MAGSAPAQAVYCWHPGLWRDVQALLAAERFDAIHVEHLRGARYGLAVRHALAAQALPTPIIWDSVDCITNLFEKVQRSSNRTLSRLVARLELPRTRRYEATLAALFDRTLVVSRTEAAAFSRLLDCPHVTELSRIRVVPNGVDLDYFAPPTSPRDPATILFSGKMSYHANVTAAAYLLDEVFPRVQSQIPEARLVIAGQNPPAQLQKRATSQIELTGTVPDLRPWLTHATVSCAPILYGAGVQNKVLEALACGTATVTTPAALDALDARPGCDLLVGEDSEALSAAIVRLLRDASLRQSLEQNGRRYVERHHRWERSGKLLEEVYREAGQAGRGE